MAQRLFMEAGRVILSRPGYDAAPALGDEYKILDSDWGYAGLLLESGTHIDPSAPVFSGGEYFYDSTTDATSWTVYFNQTFEFIPTVCLYLASYGANETTLVNFVKKAPDKNQFSWDIFVYEDRVVLNRFYNGVWYSRIPNNLFMMVYGW